MKEQGELFEDGEETSEEGGKADGSSGLNVDSNTTTRICGNLMKPPRVFYTLGKLKREIKFLKQQP